MSCGVYLIFNKTSEKAYIGSSVNIEERFNHHKSYLRRNKHGNEHLQRSWKIYGETSFEFSILETCLEEELGIREIFYCEQYNCLSCGYNIALIQENRSFKISPESYKKAVATRTKNGNLYPSEETKRKISQANKGRIAAFKRQKHTEEAKKKLSEAAKNRIVSKETKDKISKAKKGRKFTKEHKAKIAEKLKIRMKELTTCEHCGTVINVFNYRKYHGKNCKISK